MVTTRRGAQRQDNVEAPQGAVPSTSSRRGRGGAGRGRGRSAARAAPAASVAAEVHRAGEDGEHIDAAQNPTEGLPPAAIAGGRTSEDATEDYSSEGRDSSPEAAEAPKMEAAEPVNAKGVEPAGAQRREAASESSEENSGSESSDGEEHDEADVNVRRNSNAGVGVNVGSEENAGSDDKAGSDDDNAGSEKIAGGDDNAASADDDTGSDPSSGSDSDDEALFGPNLMDQLAASLKDALQARAGVEAALPPAQQAGSPVKKLGVTSDPDAIQWQPELPKSKVLGQDGSKRGKPGAGASKEKGLASQLLAPPRVKAGDAPSASDASKKWFQLPATKITDDVKQELRLLRLRGAYDPKRFYKSFDETKFPKHFQIGTVMDNPQDFYSSRLTARERGASITQELLADPSVAAARKKRYTKLQQEATRYQKVKKRKTDLKREKAPKKRPKH